MLILKIIKCWRATLGYFEKTSLRKFYLQDVVIGKRELQTEGMACVKT